MPHFITIDHLVRWTYFLWFFIIAVWLGSLPFLKPTLHKQSGATRFEQAAVFATGLYLLFGSPANPDWFNQPVFAVTLPVALAGFGLAACGIGFSIWARLTLGENWSDVATIKQDHALVVRGPYRVVRHPIYSGLLVALLGSALQRGLVRSFVAVVVCAVGLWLKVSVEEHFMVVRFGEQYLRYRRRVSALVPFIF
jgi:protein-S-isoprenylcysteine O-methyltransferase Ste14